MKLIIAIVQDEDSSRLLTKLMEEGFGVTKLATTGGFLRSGNTTLLLGVEETRLDEAVKAIESVCKSRQQISGAASYPGGGVASSYASQPVNVTIGGATLFILSVDQFMKI